MPLRGGGFRLWSSVETDWERAARCQSLFILCVTPGLTPVRDAERRAYLAANTAKNRRVNPAIRHAGHWRVE